MELLGERVGDTYGEVINFVEDWKAATPYMIAHTSGSTGTPKEVKLLKSDMVASAKMTCDFLGVGSNSLMALVLSPEYIAGKMMIVRAMMSDSTLWLEKSSNHPLANYNLDNKIDLLAVVPSQLDFLLSHKRLDKVKNILIGGSPLSSVMESRLVASGVNGYVTYGMTETCSHVALRRLGEDCYCSMPGVKFDIDLRGCLKILCPHLSIGRIVTNDIVDLQDDTRFRWLGRYDNVINSGGIKLFPEDIEKLISSIIPNINFYFGSRKSERWGEELVMIVEDNLDIDHTFELLSTIPNPIQRPKAIIVLEELPRTTTGKIKRLPFELLEGIVAICNYSANE